MIKIASHIRKLTFAPCVSANSKRQKFLSFAMFQENNFKKE